jgi:hypothetical protein
MEPLQASVTGTLRIIALLILVWAVLRLIRNRSTASKARKGTNWAAPEQRPKGEVRIERIKDPGKGSGRDPGSISDAEFEEVK